MNKDVIISISFENLSKKLSSHFYLLYTENINLEDKTEKKFNSLFLFDDERLNSSFSTNKLTIKQNEI